MKGPCELQAPFAACINMSGDKTSGQYTLDSMEGTGKVERGCPDGSVGKGLDAKHNSLSLIPGIHVVKR